MLAFYPRFTRTLDDLPGHISLLVHAWNGCNLRCYGCHNYDELIAARPTGHLNAAQVIHRLKGADQLFDALLLSGGEFLINEYDEIEAFLTGVRTVYEGKIVILTNGTYPRKLQRLLAAKLIDGAHVDMKLPFHLMDAAEDREIYQAVLGVAPSARLGEDVLESVAAVIRHNSELSQVRTVRYPLLSDEYFEFVRQYVEALKEKHSSDVPYFLNPYYPPSGAATKAAN